MAERFPDFEIQEIQEQKETKRKFGKPKIINTKKITLIWFGVWTSWVKDKNFETNLLAYEVKQLVENKQMLLHD